MPLQTNEGKQRCTGTMELTMADSKSLSIQFAWLLWVLSASSSLTQVPVKIYDTCGGSDSRFGVWVDFWGEFDVVLTVEHMH